MVILNYKLGGLLVIADARKWILIRVFWSMSVRVGAMSSLRASYNMLSAGLPSNFTHNPMGNIFSSAGIRNFGSLDGSGQFSSSANLHSVLGSSGIPGLAATSGTGLHNDMRGYDHQRRCDFFAANMHDHHVKREEVWTIIYPYLLLKTKRVTMITDV